MNVGVAGASSKCCATYISLTFLESLCNFALENAGGAKYFQLLISHAIPVEPVGQPS